jgi:uncharacterized protein
VVGVLLAMLLCQAPAVTAQESLPRPGTPSPLIPSITVAGSGSVPGRPDTAELMAGVVARSSTAAQALAQNSASMEKVLKAVTGMGIAERDVQTRGFSVAPQRRPGRPEVSQPPEIVGYEVTNEVRVKVRDLNILGRLLDQLVSEGANVLGGVQFSVDDPAPLLDQARAKAMADARRKAALYAREAGVKLGRVLLIQESSAAVPVPRFMAAQAMAAAPSVPVAPGEQEFQASVSVTYAIE